MFILRVLAASILTASLVQAWAADAPAPRVFRYSILFNGKTSGSEVDTYTPGGRVDSLYEFNDRGRGPKLTIHYRIGPDGLPLSTDITGVDYLKAPVDEHFAYAGGIASWKSTSEKGQASSPGFYVSLNSPTVEVALLVDALTSSMGVAHQASVHLLPAGEARLERLADVTLSNHGQTIHVTDYAITGLYLTPLTLWLDDDHRLFGAPGTWSAILREGWESSNDQLYALDQKAEDARYLRIAKELARPATRPVAIEHVRLFDSENATTVADQTVVIAGERIAAVGPSNAVSAPADAERIDGAGKTLLPGLFDMHVHLQPSEGMLNIASGVTSVRDMGNDIADLKHLKDQWDSGLAIGPRVSEAGFIDGRGPFQAPTGLYADTPQEAEAAVNRYADLGYIQIKIYSSLKPELVPVVIKAAHARGLRVSGHIPNGMIASQFVEDGADELQHINFVFLNFFPGKVKDTRTPERFTAVGENAAGLDLNSSNVQRFIDLLKSHGTTVDVTLATFEGMFSGRPHEVSPDLAPVLDRLPAQVQRFAYSGGLPVTAANDQLYKDSYTAMLRMTKRLYEAGVPILAGTDSMAGIMLHRELELEVKAGIPAPKALQIATWNAARLLKQEQDLGSIAPGKRADLVLVEGNPGDTISDIRRCRTVWKNGVRYDSAALYAAVSIKPAP